MGNLKGLPPKDVQCTCGNVITLQENSDWCTKCANKVFYDEKDQRRHRFHKYYTWVIILSVITFLTYIFIELLFEPVLNLK